jgi:hypothetical protein
MLGAIVGAVTCRGMAYAVTGDEAGFYRAFFNAYGMTINSEYTDDDFLAALYGDMPQDLQGSIATYCYSHDDMDWYEISRQSWYPDLCSYVVALYKTFKSTENAGIEGLYQFKLLSDSPAVVKNSALKESTVIAVGDNWGFLAHGKGMQSNDAVARSIANNNVASWIPSSSDVRGILANYSSSSGSQFDFTVVELLSLSRGLDYIGYTSQIIAPTGDDRLYTLLAGGLRYEEGEVLDIITNGDILSIGSSDGAKVGIVPIVRVGGNANYASNFTWRSISRFLGGDSHVFASGANGPASIALNEEWQAWLGTLDPDAGFDLGLSFQWYLAQGYTSPLTSPFYDDPDASYVLQMPLSTSSTANSVLYLNNLYIYSHVRDEGFSEVAVWGGEQYSIPDYNPSLLPGWLLGCEYALNHWYDDITQGNVVVISDKLTIVEDTVTDYGNGDYLDALSGQILNANMVSLALKASFEDELMADDTIIAGGGDGKTVEKALNDGDIGTGDSQYRPDWSRKFPFSLPWDLVGILKLFQSRPITPSFEVPGAVVNGKVVITIADFSEWQPVSTVLRGLLTALFVFGLVRWYMAITGIAGGGGD